MSAKFQQNWSL